MSTYTAGPYVVRIGLRHDNPAWPVYLVYRGDRLVGRSFSMPDRGWCDFLKRQGEAAVHHAVEREKFTMRKWTMGRRGRPTNAERARREAMLLMVEE